MRRDKDTDRRYLTEDGKRLIPHRSRAVRHRDRRSVATPTPSSAPNTLGALVRDRPEPMLDAAAWRMIAEALTCRSPATDPVRTAIAHGEGTVTELHKAQAVTADGSPLFPLPRGPKPGRFWIRQVAEPDRLT